MATTKYKFNLFEVIGIEIEYMLVNKFTLNVSPISDLIIQGVAGKITDCAPLNQIDISNELVMHVIELKHHKPTKISPEIYKQFYNAHKLLIPILEQHNIVLLPTAAHPWMNPLEETKRWPYGQSDIYEQYNKIFNCQGHGWSNLQSVHLNLPFGDEGQFVKLHQAIRHLLPIIPALCASSPILNNRKTGILDTRLHYYGSNQQKVPEITGDVIPEQILSYSDYKKIILMPMYNAIEPYDPKNFLREDWLNSRGVIAKFDVGALEIRIIDSQECVKADVAIALLICKILQYWVKNNYFADHNHDIHKTLVLQYQESIKNGLNTPIIDHNFTQLLRLNKVSTVRDIWLQILELVSHDLDQTTIDTINYIIKHGNLSERINSKLNNDYTEEDVKNIYLQIANCHHNNEML